ncbi:S1 family peptidase [Streptomyces sp. NPDC060194]|uniref:S1 family peptidase n=1 Tax=Streptomyces sp. NPDC060194 TaxID=3347069 RepID=UPI0036674CC6
MKHRRTSGRRIAVTGTAAAALIAAGVTFQTANAADADPAPAPDTLSAKAAGELASELGARLDGDAAGAYYDADARTLVVNVLDKAAADTVAAAGGRARVVENSLAELRAARTTLTDRASIGGTSWATDPVSNKIVVTADRTVDGTALAKLEKVVASLGGRAELNRTKGEFKPLVSGGDAIHTGGGRCSLGFNVVKDGAPHFITAGHCGQAGSTWAASQGGTPVGTMTDSRFPGSDFALVKYDDAGASAPSEVNLYNGSAQNITGAAEATVGMEVTRSGSTTQVHGGTVTGLDATVNYGGGDIVEGLIQTNVCAEPGDSGGSLFSGSSAVGLTSGGSGNCSSGGTTFFQPVTEALSAYGATIG